MAGMQFVLFTDNLNSFKVPDLLAEAKKIGFDGLDLTLRPGGHVEPQNAEVGLAEAKRAADEAGMTIPMVTTSITDAGSPHAESIFASAAHYGARRMKLGYWHYEGFGTLARQIDATRARLEGVVKLGEKYHVLPCIHVHSGDVLANGGALAYLLLKDFKPEQAGAYVDPMHMAVEGGLKGWEMGLDLLAPWVALCAVKNFRWKETARDEKGQMRYGLEYVSVADGQAPIPEFMARLKEIKFDGVVSIHAEYRALDARQLLERAAADVKYLRSVVNEPKS
jgi:sugar phosphate isomerase/epimerase